MNLDRWVSWRLGAILLTSAVIGLLITLAVIRERFDTLEIWLTERQLSRVERVLEQERFDMERISADYAQWDDALAYLEGRRPEFVAANFPRNTGDNLNVDAVIIRGADDTLALAIALSGEEDFLAWPQARVDAVSQALAVWPKDGVLRRDSRLFFIDGRPVMVGRTSVTDSAQEVPAAGSLTFVRELDESDLARLSGLADVQFSLEAAAPGDASTLMVVPNNEGWMGRKILEDGAALQVNVPALLTRELAATVWALVLAAALNLLVSVVWVRKALKQKVTGRLGHFATLSALPSVGMAPQQRWPVDGDDEIDRLAGALNRLVDDLERQQAALDRIAHEDVVTGLENRRRLLDLLCERVNDTGAHAGAPSALVYIDLVGFKPINDALGHAAGDMVLRSIADRMRALPAPLSHATRVGGDEFGLILDGVNLQAAAEWFEGVVENLVAEVDCGGQRVRFDLVAGIAEKPADGDAASWLSMADLAMYAARRERRGRIGLFSEDLRSAVQSRHLIGKHLYAAIDAGEIEAWFQPVVRLHDHAVVGFETLARWRLDGAWIPPSQFIPVAEEEGLIGALTLQMLGQSCDFLDALEKANRADIVCSVNVSPVQVADHRLPAQLMAVLADRHVDPRRVAIEVTEEAIESRPERVAQTFSTLRAFGFQLWLDDFGIGHASFARLRDYPFDLLKIDRSFVKARNEARAASLLEGIIRFGSGIGLPVTAEGVESESDLAALRAMGCDRAQGFHLARPMPAADAMAWLVSRALL